MTTASHVPVTELLAGQRHERPQHYFLQSVTKGVGGMIYRRRIVLEGIREPKPLCLGHTGDSKKGHLRACAGRRPGIKMPTPRSVPSLSSRPHLSKSTFSAKPAACLGTSSGHRLTRKPEGSELWSRVISPWLQFLPSSGFLGSLCSPGILPPPDGSSFTHGMTSTGSLRQPLCQKGSFFPMRPPVSHSIVYKDVTPAATGHRVRRPRAVPREY